MELTRKKKVFWGISIFVVILLAGTITTAYLLVMHSQPKIEGELLAKGINSDVRILRDEFGVPHIYADNERDLMFAAGYAQAQDRLWQMDFLRRVSEGRLSEIFGSRTLQADKALRTIGFSRVAKMITDSLNERTRMLLQAYAEGVNSFIRANRENYPVEFVLLQFAPKDWQVEHSIGIARVMAWQLSMGWYVDVAYDKILDSVGFQKLQDILPRYPDDAPVVVKNPTGRPAIHTDTTIAVEEHYRRQDFRKAQTNTAIGILDEFVNANLQVKEWIGNNGFSIGSNSWVVSGARSQTGKPLLANDPHLGHGVPSTWYEMQLSGGGWDVTGFALPGSPFIVIGNNRNIAWGLTAVMTDDADFYREQIKDSTYYFDGKWQKLQWSRENIVIKDSIPFLYDIPYTHRGPIVNTLYDIPDSQPNAVSVRWLGHVPSGEIMAFSKIARAENWEEFRNAASSFKVPGMNVVYADINGNIGYQCMTGVPVRRNGNGIAILDGTIGQNDWLGEIPFESLPASYNPSEGYLASANNKIAGDWFTYFVSNYWENPSRIRRIDQLLNSKEKFNTEDFKLMQNDLFSFHAKEIIPYILDACKTDSVFTYFPSKNASNFPYYESYLFLKHWDFNMAPDSRGAAIFNVFFQKLLINLYRDEMGETLFESFIKLSNVPARVTTQLLINKQSSWWDDTRTKEIENRDMIIRRSLADAVDFLQDHFGKEPGGWTWEKLHHVTFEHPMGKQKPLNHLFNVGPFSIGGNTTTVNNTEFHYSDPQFKVLLGASMRRIVDLSDISRPLTVLTLGQSGQPYNAHYYDQNEMWLTGRYKTCFMNENEINKSFSKLLILKPQ